MWRLYFSCLTATFFDLNVHWRIVFKFVFFFFFFCFFIVICDLVDNVETVFILP